MNQWWPRKGEKLAVLLAVLGLGACIGWSWHQRAQVSRIRALSVAIVPTRGSGAGPEPGPGSDPPARPVAGESPPAALPGHRGIFDRPAPPAHHSGPSSTDMAGPGDELELVRVGREPFRLQLAGYVGEAGSYLVLFRSPGRTEAVGARVGDRLPEFRLQLRQFAVVPRPADEEAASGGARMALAVMFDESAGAEVELNDRAPTLTDRVVATVQTRRDAAGTFALREGESLPVVAGGGVVERIRLDPPEVVIAFPGASSVRTGRLTLRRPGTGGASGVINEPSPPALAAQVAATAVGSGDPHPP